MSATDTPDQVIAKARKRAAQLRDLADQIKLAIDAAKVTHQLDVAQAAVANAAGSPSVPPPGTGFKDYVDSLARLKAGGPMPFTTAAGQPLTAIPTGFGGVAIRGPPPLTLPAAAAPPSGPSTTPPTGPGTPTPPASTAPGVAPPSPSAPPAAPPQVLQFTGTPPTVAAPPAPAGPLPPTTLGGPAPPGTGFSTWHTSDYLEERLVEVVNVFNPSGTPVDSSANVGTRKGATIALNSHSIPRISAYGLHFAPRTPTIYDPTDRFLWDVQVDLPAGTVPFYDPILKQIITLR